MLTIPEIIQIAEVSEYLAFLDYKNRGLFGGGNDPKLPRKLYCIRKNVEWLYDLDPTNTTLPGTALYLYALCAPYSGEALLIIASGGGGIVVNPSTGQPVNLQAIEINFEMGVTASPIPVNGVNITLPVVGANQFTIPLENIIDRSLQVVKDGVVLPRSSTLSQYATIQYFQTQAIITLLPVGSVFDNSQVWEITGYQTILA